MPEGWSRFEVEATVADYFVMLKMELRGVPFNKSAHRRALSVHVKRSHLAIDRKHMNVSAILSENGYPWIDGYKPYPNWQKLLREIVVNRLSGDEELKALIESVITEEPKTREISDLLRSVVAAPVRLPKPPKTEIADGLPNGGVKRNYLEQEARNSALGRAGEEFVLQYERSRLASLGLTRLADRVEHVAITIGDREGFDVRSFGEDGTDRLIEVKTTNFGSRTPFFVTANELRVSRGASETYHLYRLFDFKRAPRQFQLKGALDEAFSLSASIYRATR
jgi:hypothetical protein